MDLKKAMEEYRLLQRLQTRVANSRPIMTPLGKFYSRKDAAATYNRNPNVIDRRMKQKPNEYYYL